MSFLRNAAEAAARAKKIVLDHFTYTAAFAPLLANATANVVVPISADSDFLWMETCLVAYTAANTPDPTPDMLISFQDTGAGRNLQDNPVHVALITGNGQWPFVLPEPKILVGNGAMQITLVNNTAVQCGRVSIALIGVKMFYLEGYNRSKLIMGL
jgi:hypothetical protein